MTVKKNNKKKNKDEIDNVNNRLKKISLKEDSSILKYKNKGKPSFKPVHLTYKAYKRMFGYSIRYANEHLESKKWKEVYGILIGTVNENKCVIVKDAIPVCVGGRSGVELKPIHYVDLSQINTSVYERDIEDNKTDFIVGWWHTHPGFGFFFSRIDIKTQLGFQVPNPFAVGLIFDHNQKRADFLGVAALRLKNPNKGIFSDYRIVKLSHDLEISVINKKIEKVREKIYKNMDKVLNELNYIHNVLNKKLLTNLLKNYSLFLIPRKEVDFINYEGVVKEEDKNKLYIWELDYEAYTQKPKFRKKIENEIKKSKEALKNLINRSQLDVLDSQRKVFNTKIKNMLSKPNKMYYLIIKDFIKRIDVINPYYNYLDSNERKIIESFETRLNNYFDILDEFNKKAELNLENLF